MHLNWVKDLILFCILLFPRSCILALGSLIPMMFPCKSFWSAMFCVFTAHITEHVYLIHLPTGTHFTFVVHRSQGCQGSSQNVFHVNHQVAHLFQTRPVRRAATVAPSAESRRTEFICWVSPQKQTVCFFWFGVRNHKPFEVKGAYGWQIMLFLIYNF